MQIVTRSAPFSYSAYSLLPSVPLLTAPPPPKLLAAPRIAGLLPARVSSHSDSHGEVEAIVEIPLTRGELIRQLGPIRSRAEMNAEITALILAPLNFRPARPAVRPRPLPRTLPPPAPQRRELLRNDRQHR